MATPAKASATASPGRRDLVEGDLLDGKYRIGVKLGQGGMGAVYRALHLGTKRPVAVKVIRPRYSDDEEFVGRFRREAEAAGRLRHPNVVDVTDFGFAETPAGRVAYLVMEYLDGCTLAEVLAEEERLPRDRVVDILSQVCSAVEEAHRHGIIHRDLKPENIWLEPNRRGGYTVKVLDFGLVKMETAALARVPARPALPVDTPFLSESDTLARTPISEGATPPRARVSGLPSGPSLEEESGGGLTRVGSLLGTPLYMSPEQWRGEPLDARSDVYSLGVIAYRMLAGRTPYKGTADELLRLHATATPPPLSGKVRVPRAMARVVMSALAKEPAARPSTADGFAAALRSGAEGPGELLQQAIALYGSRFPVFFRASLLGYAPLAAVVVALYLIDGDPPWLRLDAGFLGMAGPALLVAMLATSFLAYALVSALTVPLVVESIVSPLRPLRLRTAISVLGRQSSTLTRATLAVMALVAGGSLLLVVPGILALLAHALYAPVTVIEGGSVRAVLRRARDLARRSWGSVLVITVLQFALPVLVFRASVTFEFTLKLDDHYRLQEYGYRLVSSGGAALFQLLNILVTPLTAVMSALLYLKLRRAGGESLLDAAERFDALGTPLSGWQARVRGRMAASGRMETGDRSS